MYSDQIERLINTQSKCLYSVNNVIKKCLQNKNKYFNFFYYKVFKNNVYNKRK